MSLQFGKIVAEKGSRYSGFLDAGYFFPEAPKNYIRRVAQVPFTVIRGQAEGPTLCVSAGNDPTEYAAIGAALKLAKDIISNNLIGNLIVIHVANILAFWEKKYLSSIDHIQLTDAYPGNPTGTPTEVLAYHVFKELISKSDFYIDLHGGDIHELQLGRSYFYRIGDSRIDTQSEMLARELGHGYIIPREGKKKSKEVPGESIEIAALHGIPAALSELGTGDSFLQQEIQSQFDAVIRVMRYLGMIEGDRMEEKDQKTINEIIRFTANRSGLFYSHIKPGDILSPGEILGEVKDLFGEVTETLSAPKRGVVLSMIRNPVVDVGQLIILDFGILS
jgi:uncharacterized protein